MSDKPREYFIYRERNFKIWSEYPCEKTETNECTHVIEYAAYEKLQKENKIMREALKAIRNEQHKYYEQHFEDGTFFSDYFEFIDKVFKDLDEDPNQ